MSMRHLALACATTLVAALLVALPASTASAAQRGYVYCPYGGGYVSKSKLISAKRAAAVTHLSTFTAAPGYSKKTTKTVRVRTVLRGSVRLNAEVSASLGNKIISKGEAKLGLQLAASGSRTRETNTTVTEVVKNTSSQNATIVMFRGNKRGYGRWKRSYCSQVTGAIGQVKWQKGRWGSFVSLDDGYVRCGAGTANINAVAKKAYALGCA